MKAHTKKRIALGLGLAAAAVLGGARPASAASVDHVTCDIVVAGGSTASLATAITAAEASNYTVCLTDPTDWLGGQLTAGGVPAIDFGYSISQPDNQARSFRDMMQHIPGNPGACTVSTKCYEPQWLVDTWITPRVARSPNLRVFLRTVVTATSRDATTGAVTGITAVQRTPRDPSQEWTELISEELDDWYSPQDSSAFTKTEIQFTGKVFVEATEFGDVLLTGGLPFTQGAETPTEFNLTTTDQCGQAATLTFYMELLAEKPANPIPVPPGGDQGQPFSPSPDIWPKSWVFRRNRCVGNRSTSAVNVGDITQQNWPPQGNDLDTAYLFLSVADAKEQRPWRGGMNRTALRMLQGRAFGWYHWFAGRAPDATMRDRLVLNYNNSGTRHGLSKMPYLRDTRRAVGVDGFRLSYPPLNYDNASSPGTGYRFEDTVALGNYNDDTHGMTSCRLPNYTAVHDTKPYYIPVRALTVEGSPNLLVAGKTMSQTFHANSAVRLHPSEWSSGVAAGGAAVLMRQRGLTTADLSRSPAAVRELQAFLNSSAIGQPLDWSGVPGPADYSYVCGLSRCILVDHVLSNQTAYANATCGGHCTALAADEWLAFTQFWRPSGAVIVATEDTVLKKSPANSGELPPKDKMDVTAGSQCRLVNAQPFEDHYLCTYPAKA